MSSSTGWTISTRSPRRRAGRHSRCLATLGALIASAYAGVFPEQVERLILLEGLGPLSQPDEAVPEQLRRAILNRSRTRERASQGFASIDEAVAARCKVADIDPGSARLICERQLEVRAGRWHWRSDPRLRDLSPCA